ncbi:hypothetical protein HaLaN_22149 [Haematococcus lacustris]|uniref:Uncharacterized protein n=1 Tax=Haematococcus lacustris TaxID=44745 RepID=A0A699ZR13_HAELA|nr:hypothetical protein HaLaN_22149 [Haematococcus lacustris]
MERTKRILPNLGKMSDASERRSKLELLLQMSLNITLCALFSLTHSLERAWARCCVIMATQDDVRQHRCCQQPLKEGLDGGLSWCSYAAGAA